MAKIVTTTYICPDLDGYSCAVAYAELLRAQGKQAQAHIWGEPQLEVEWLLETFHLPAALGSIADPTVHVIFLDARSPKHLPSPLEPDQVIEIIDHHPKLEEDVFRNATVQIEMVSAAATLVTERFQKAGITPSKESALFLFGGIISNSQNYLYATDRDRATGAWMQEISGAPEDFVHQLFAAKSDLTGSKLVSCLSTDTKMFTIKGKKVGTTQLEVIGVRKLIDTRRGEIEEVLQKIKQDSASEYTFTNMKDLESGLSYILCVDEQTLDLLKKLPDVKWHGRLGESKTLTFRKQINVWIDEKLSRVEK